MEIRHVAASTLMVIVLTGAAACGGSDSSSSSSPARSTAPAGTGQSAEDTSSPPKGPHTTLKGIDFCKALTADSLTAVGVQPSAAIEGSESGRSSDSGCDWKTGETEVQINAISDWPVNMSEGQKKINILGFPGIQDVVIGNGCEVTMQVKDDELEVNVLNDDGSNQTLQGSKACDAATDFTRQALKGVTAK
jgi:Protein of unknown function (DUF3558)